MNEDIENTNSDNLRFAPSTIEASSPDNPGQKIDVLIENIGKVVKGHREQIIQIITCLIAKGHILLEDNPGSGKTVMAKNVSLFFIWQKRALRF